MLEEAQGDFLEAWSRLCLSGLFLMTFVMGGISHAGSQRGETQAGIKIARRNINNLRYADDTTLMAESEEELKSILMKWKRRVKKLV